MSKSIAATTKRDPSYMKIKKLEESVVRLEPKQKENDYIVNSLKAEIRLLRDTLSSIKNNAKDALTTEDIMFESLNSNIENRSHLKHDGEDILYPGEDKKIKTRV